jgi:hypothetical protein
MYSDNNCELLINENRNITLKNQKISMISIDDYIGGNAGFLKTVTGIRKTNPSIVLSHCPEHRGVTVEQKGKLIDRSNSFGPQAR